MEITTIGGMNVYYDGKQLKTDAHGKNAAFLCPVSGCEHPIILAIPPVHRGKYETSPAECRGCKAKYVISSVDEDKIYIKSVGG